ncbi:ECF transporter S component [Corynebacterium callunae]|uniref:ECF transporter S component n=1 Tax=Corynebacterium callunae TaxID=1721 RepID=UPI00200058B0|nr:ECF transporter S component [Corynebacterium callunae]MCK2201113.1 ECF transporter S component [Corynebacterium callunae]
MTTTRMSKKASQWRVIDIVIAAVLGVACGLIFVVWNSIGYAWTTAFDALTPGLGGFAIGIWLLGGVLGGLIIRKPGAATFVEVLAACVSAALASQWGIATIYSGLAQGIGAEIIFAIFLYRRFNLSVAVLSGMGAGLGAILLELFFYGNAAKSLAFNAIYGSTVLVSGAILAGALGWFLVRALARTGALERFAAGREYRQEV